MIEVIYKEDTTEQEAAQEAFSMPRKCKAESGWRTEITGFI